jgi:hypothetical protein
MAVQIVRSPHSYVGTSSDLFSLSAIPEGSTFQLLNPMKGESFIAHEDMWIPDRQTVTNFLNQTT